VQSGTLYTNDQINDEQCQMRQFNISYLIGRFGDQLHVMYFVEIFEHIKT
jgi:hypothetical protein